MSIDNWITAVLALRRAKRVAFFTGAGVSAESGIPTFRDVSGFWQRFPPEQFASWKGLLKTVVTNPREVAEFVHNVIEPIANATPNPAHLAIANLERRVETTVVTQNVDGLHQAAGSTKVWEIHGSLFEIIDHTTGSVVHRLERSELSDIAAKLQDYVARKQSLMSLLWTLRRLYPLDWLGRHRPNLVLFGDSLAEPAWTNACQAVEDCDLLITVGTLGAVYPAALLPDQALAAGATVVSIDPQPSVGCWLKGLAGVVLPKLLSNAFGDSA